MTNARTIPFRFYSICIATVAFSLMAPVSFADVSLQVLPPPEHPLALEMFLGTNRSTHAPLVNWLVTSEEARSCFWGENRSRTRLNVDELNRPELFTYACVRIATNADELGWTGHEANGDHAKSIRNWTEAEHAYANAVSLLERTADHERSQNLAALLNKLGATRFNQKDFAGAEQAFRQALTIYTATRGAEDLHVADSLDLLASALFEQRQHRILAGPLFYRAGAIREASLAQDHPAIADSLYHIAISLYSDNLAIAIPLFLRSKQIREQVFGHDHPLVEESLNTMALLFELHDRPDLAIPLYQEALTIHEKVLGASFETIPDRDYLNMVHRMNEGLDPKAKK